MLLHNLTRCYKLCTFRNPLLDLLSHLGSRIRWDLATTTAERNQ